MRGKSMGVRRVDDTRMRAVRERDDTMARGARGEGLKRQPLVENLQRVVSGRVIKHVVS